MEIPDGYVPVTPETATQILKALEESNKDGKSAEEIVAGGKVFYIDNEELNIALLQIRCNILS